MMEKLRRESDQSESLRRILGTRNALFDLKKREKKLLTVGLSESVRLKEVVLDLGKEETTTKNTSRLKDDIIKGIRNLLKLEKVINQK